MVMYGYGYVYLSFAILHRFFTFSFIQISAQLLY